MSLDGRVLASPTPAVVEGILPSAPVAVMLTAKDRKSASFSLEGNPGQLVRRVHAQLPAALGSLVVESSPAGAQVHLDDRSLGVTPLNIDGVRLDERHRIDLALPGYELDQLVVLPEKDGQRVLPHPRARARRRFAGPQHPVTLHLAFAGALGQQRLPLVGDLMVGRGAESAVRFEARNVSRCHARLMVENGTVFVEDLGSRNGTLLNGQLVRGRRKLRDGDVLQVADEILRVEDRAAGDTDELDAAEPTPAPFRPPPLPRPPGRLRVALTAALRALSGKGA